MPRLFGCALPLLQPGPAHQIVLTPADPLNMSLMPFACLHASGAERSGLHPLSSLNSDDIAWLGMV